MSLPNTDAARKALPIFDGVVMYFPDALAAVAEVSVNGNNQHNPGQPLHWAKGKSMDQFNTALRHMIDHKAGNTYDYRYDNDKKSWVQDGRHLAKAAWRVLAALQLSIESEQVNSCQAGQAQASGIATGGSACGAGGGLGSNLPASGSAQRLT